MHNWVAFPSLFLVELGAELKVVDDRSLHDGHTTLHEMGFDSLKKVLAETVLSEQMPERQVRCVIGDPIADRFDSCQAEYGR